MRDSTNKPSTQYEFWTMPLGAGGFATNIDIADDGTLIHGTDIHNGYWKMTGDRLWKRLFTAQSLGAMIDEPDLTAWPWTSTSGVFGLGLCKSQGNVFYVSWGGYIYKSTDRAASWTRLAGRWRMDGNAGGSRTWQDKLVVDPQNPNVFMCATNEDKLLYCLDGSTVQHHVLPTTPHVASFTSDPAIKTPVLVACDPNGPVVGGVKQRWAYSLVGQGVFESTTGPAGPFTLISGAITNTGPIAYDWNGNLWMAERNTADAIYKRIPGGSFVKLNTGFYNCDSIAPSKVSPNYVVFSTENGPICLTKDAGATYIGSWNLTWPPPYGITRQPGKIRYLGAKRGQTFYHAQIKYHPVSDVLYMAHGFGVAKSGQNPQSFVEWFWDEEALGTEAIMVRNLVKPVGSPHAIAACLDKGVFLIKNEHRWVNPHDFPNPASGIESCWFIDDVWNKPGMITISCNYWNESSGYSMDYGETLQQVNNLPWGQNIFMGGQLLARNENEFFWFPARDIRPGYSSDRGLTWDYLNIPGWPTSGELGYSFSHWTPTLPAMVDKTNGDFYVWNYGPGQAPSARGIYKCPYGANPLQAASWIKVRNDLSPFGINSGIFKMMSYRGQAGRFFGPGDNGSLQQGIWETRDGFQTIQQIPNVQWASTVNIGAPAPGRTNWTFYFWGSYNNVKGLYRSVDDWATIELITLHPAGSIDEPQNIFGDLEEFGKLYIGMGNSGGVIGKYKPTLVMGP